MLSSEKYLISKAKETKDPYEAKAWIIAAKTLFPNDFGIQFEAYEIEKAANNYEEAAKCFSYMLVSAFPSLVMVAQDQPSSLWSEISQITSALRVPEGGTTTEQEFYVKMFQYISYEVQHKILLLTANHSNNNLDHCRLILLLLKRFPQAIQTHAPRLLDTLVQNINNIHFKEMLITEALPLIYSKPHELSSNLVHHIMAICFEYYVNQMFNDLDDKNRVVADSWKKIFEILEFCGKNLKWEPFLPYKKTWNKDIYWQKIIQIVSSVPPRPSENKQILFCATIVFVLSLQEYVENIKYKTKENDVEIILLEGIKEASAEPAPANRRMVEAALEAPQISVNPPCPPETPSCLVTAAQCWQLLHSNDILQNDFTQLIRSIPLSSWIKRFLLDLSVYMGRHEETQGIIKTASSRKMSVLEKNLRYLSLNLAQNNITVQSFEYINSILTNLPNIIGSYLHTTTPTSNSRNLILLPMTRRAILQYIVQILINGLKSKLSDHSCTSSLMGNLLVLTQLNWPHESSMADLIFDLIKSRRNFSYLLFPNYVINIALIEEFMHLWTHCADIKLEFVLPQANLPGTRRIGTRGADKGVKEDFKQIMKLQISRSNEDIDLLIVQFLQQEQIALIQNIFEK